MGTTYLVRSPLSRDLFALKIPHTVENMNGAWERSLFQLSFANEVEAASRIDKHPNIVQVLDVDLTPSSQYLLMEYVAGGITIKRCLARGQALSLTRRLRWIHDCALALGHLHDRGIVHRDIKPSNILVTSTGAKIFDFGVAEFMTDSPHGYKLAHAGSPKYMSPEQIAQMPLTGQSDIFSLGCVLAELLVGRHPFHGTCIGEVQRRILTAPVPTTGCRFGRLSPILDRILNRALARDPAARYHSAYDFAGELRVMHDLARRDSERRHSCEAYAASAEPERAIA